MAVHVAMRDGDGRCPMNDPITCDCDDPHADAIGQCADCKRLVVQPPKVQLAFPAASAPTVTRLGIGDVVVVTHEHGPSLTFPTPAALRAWLGTVAAELDVATGPRVDVAALLADEAMAANDLAYRAAVDAARREPEPDLFDPPCEEMSGYLLCDLHRGHDGHHVCNGQFWPVETGQTIDEWRAATDEALRLAMHPPHQSTVDWTPEVDYWDEQR